MQPYALQLVTGPAVEPVSVAQAKAHLRIDYANDDVLIAMQISAARTYVEQLLARAIYAQTWTVTLDAFPWPGDLCQPAWMSNAVYTQYFDQLAIRLPMPRLISVIGVTYFDDTGAVVTLDPGTYVVDASSEPARLSPAPGKQWPTFNTFRPGRVAVTFTTGSYGDGVAVDLCPAPVKQAILLMIGHLYSNREAVVLTNSSNAVTTLPLAFAALLDPYKYLGGAC